MAPLTKAEVRVGLKVRSLVPFASVPKGTTGAVTLIQMEGGGRKWCAIVTWHLNRPNNDVMERPFSRPLTDGFSDDELHFLEAVQ